MPFGAPIPPSPDASKALLAAFEERGIDWHPERLITGLDRERKVALLSDGAEMPFDLFLGVPVHRAPAVVLESPLAVDGWIPVDPSTLKTAFPDVYAVGDVTSVGTPKAGVFAEGQASVVADQIIAQAGAGSVGRTPTTARGSATSSLVRAWSPPSRSRSSAGPHRWAPWAAPHVTWPHPRPPSERTGSGVGSMVREAAAIAARPAAPD